MPPSPTARPVGVDSRCRSRQQGRSAVGLSTPMTAVRTPSSRPTGVPLPAGALPRAFTGLSRRRSGRGRAAGHRGLLVLAAGPRVGARLDFAVPVLLVLALVVATALLGGMRIALPGAVAGALALNWFLTPPYGTLRIASAEQVLVLVVYLGVAVAVSWVVDLAARRTADAARARAEAEALSGLAGAALAEHRTLPDLLAEVRRVFGMREAALLERIDGAWTVVEASGEGAPAPDEREVSRAGRPHLSLRVLGPEMFAADRRVLASFAEAAAGALVARRLAERAEEAAPAGGRRPDAHHPAGRCGPRPAHPAGLGQGRGEQPASGRRHVDRGRDRRTAGHHRGRCRPASASRGEPARRLPPAGGGRERCARAGPAGGTGRTGLARPGEPRRSRPRHPGGPARRARRRRPRRARARQRPGERAAPRRGRHGDRPRRARARARLGRLRRDRPRPGSARPARRTRCSCRSRRCTATRATSETAAPEGWGLASPSGAASPRP